MGKTRRNTRSKNAIVYLLFKSELYLIGACICGYVHQQFRKKYKLTFYLILMVDEPLYKYKKDLEYFFDKVILIDIIKFKLNKEYTKKLPFKYAETISLFTTKLNIFKLHQYNKVLALDIDTLPVNKKFYDVFNYDTPSTIFRMHTTVPSSTHYTHEQIYSKEIGDLSNQSKYLNMFLEGSIYMLSPTKTDFDDILAYMHDAEGTHGYSSHQASTADETIILHYLALKKKNVIANIPKEYCIIPWDSKNKPYYDTAYSYNYLSNIKPWNKPLFMMWKEEYIYYFISEQIIKRSTLLKRIHYRNIAKTIKEYKPSIEKGILSGRCSKDPAIKEACSTAIATANKPSIAPFLAENTSYEMYNSMKPDIEEMLETMYISMNDTTKLNMTTYGVIDKQLQSFHKLIL